MPTLQLRYSILKVRVYWIEYDSIWPINPAKAKVDLDGFRLCF